MLLKTDLREDKRMFLMNPSGASDLKYSPSYPSNFHNVLHKLLQVKGLFMHPSCITFNFYFYFRFYPHLLSSPFSLCSSHLPITLVTFHSFSHLSTMSLFCALVVGQGKKSRPRWNVYAADPVLIAQWLR